MAALSPPPPPAAAPAPTAGLRAGAQLTVTVEHVVSGTVVVSTNFGGSSFTGILIDMAKKSGLCGLLPNQFPAESCTSEVLDGKEQSICQTKSQPCNLQHTEMSNREQVSPLQPLPKTVPCLPPYCEGVPLPQPLVLRQTYNQWVPQPPPRTIKRTKRRLSRNRDPGKLIMSTIRLRPRQVLCEKCKNTLNREEEEEDDDDDDKDRHNNKNDKKTSVEENEKRKPEVTCCENRKLKKEKKDEKCSTEMVHRSPVIKISYSTPQGKGKVVKIPSRVHGSVEPFCPKRLMQNESVDQDKNTNGDEMEVLPEKSFSSPSGTIPKLKLTRPLHSMADIPPPRIRLKPHRLSNGDNVAIYKAELVDNLNSDVLPTRRSDSSALHSEESTGKSSIETSGSSGEEDQWRYKRSRRSKDQGDLTVYLSYRKKRADSSSLSVCSNDSLDESKSSSSEITSPEICDFAPGDDASVSSSSKEEKTVPPLTVRLHTKTVTKCVTTEGRTISVGDIVWGKIHGFPWWPACILGISVNKKENGTPLWQEARVSWFGSPTTSLLSVSKVSPFLEYFKLRFNRKKKGVYRRAITEAAKAAQHLTPEIRSLLSQYDS
ncbi:PWWP domain-containing protein 2B isoform X1 [Leucoraja erinacea]|uniref:PWWP domain-containing protein 2B isoform X1 n=2 Tax=Leucoraja erinaceus TaxID=7782 RepID=UPI002454FFAE|nr:PWWP domain-containing protein 2B isoform X1 [Leucoraja erinacea]XP_055502622.1 PWWP domain-containing protein 2B isoform X1 [Leucoraja erinacea]XP_055502623.1 PWWP domain-containing protein 2B isoform X1 [Leucoraja erinacea]